MTQLPPGYDGQDDFEVYPKIEPLSIKRVTATIFAVGAGCVSAVLAGILAAYVLTPVPAYPHEWWPIDCCSGSDCKVISPEQVLTTARGFVIPGNPEVVPYSSPKIRQTPPEGEGNYGLCTKGGQPDGEVLCLYIPTWGS